MQISTLDCTGDNHFGEECSNRRHECTSGTFRCRDGSCVRFVKSHSQLLILQKVERESFLYIPLIIFSLSPFPLVNTVCQFCAMEGQIAPMRRMKTPTRLVCPECCPAASTDYPVSTSAWPPMLATFAHAKKATEKVRTDCPVSTLTSAPLAALVANSTFTRAHRGRLSNKRFLIFKFAHNFAPTLCLVSSALVLRDTVSLRLTDVAVRQFREEKHC